MNVLTEKGGQFEVSDELRGMLALLDDGRLFVSKSHIFNAHVRGFMSRLKHLNFEHSVVPCDLGVIEDFYSKSKSSAGFTDMQQKATALFARAAEMRGSDIHIRVSTKHRTQILVRVHNDLEFLEEQTYEIGEQLCTTIFQALCDVSDASFESINRQDARISQRDKLPPNLDGIRVATSPQVDGFLMVLRLLYNDTSKDTDLSKLGFTPQHIDAIEYMKKRPTGIIVISGPTGSGKSTTLQRMLGAIIESTQGRKHIITVEDPPEYPIPGAVQTPVTNASTSEERDEMYQKAIKGAMRLDPDIIMLSEVRDRPTARLAIQGAMTGHQIFTTVHANGALASIDRLQDLGVPIELLTDPTIVAGVISQRLVKRLCDHCKISFTDAAANLHPSDVSRLMGVLMIENVYLQGEGCPHCRNTGVVGRTVVAETVITDNTLMKYIREGNRIEAITYVSTQQGTMSMVDHAIFKINRGEIDPFQAEEVVGLLNSVKIEQDHRISAAEVKR